VRICGAFAAILSIIASRLVTELTSAGTAANADTRIRASDLADAIGVGIQTPLTLNLYQGSESARYDVASGSLLATRGDCA